MVRDLKRVEELQSSPEEEWESKLERRVKCCAMLKALWSFVNIHSDTSLSCHVLCSFYI